MQILVPALLLNLLLASVSAQSARELTRRIAPQLPPPQQQPANRPAAVPVAPPPASATAPAVQPTQDPAKKAEADKRLLEKQQKWAEEGSDTAQYELGMRYLTGNGLEKNEKMALQWLEKAAANGSGQAKKKLAELKQKSPQAATP